MLYITVVVIINKMNYLCGNLQFLGLVFSGKRGNLEKLENSSMVRVMSGKIQKVNDFLCLEN